jgi:Tol biopolymer transport system component
MLKKLSKKEKANYMSPGGKYNVIFTIFIFLLTYSTINAQYFGQNKVHYSNFNFKELHTKHFDIYYYPEEEEGVKYAAEMAERWYARHEILFDDTLKGKQPLILYASFPQFAQTNVTSGEIGQGTGGFTEPLLRRVVMPFAGPLKETNHVLGHELVHAFQYDIGGNKGTQSNIEKLPLWFIEGMAEYFSLGPNDPFTAMWMRDAAQKKLPDVEDLENPDYFPYRFGQALLAYIGGRWGDKKINSILRYSLFSGSVYTALDSVLQISTDSLSKDWHKAIHAQYDTLLKLTSKPSDYGKVLIKGEKGGGEYNISPELSPDGKNIAFFSTRNLFSVDIFLADAKTGKIKKTILKTALDAHLQSLEFINSAGSWDPTSKYFLFITTKDGRPTLSILDIDKDEVTKEYTLKNISEIINTTWSPDGKSIVFSGLMGGLSNLYMYNLETGKLENLTNDAYGEIEPEFSPDGKKIVFSTDRFSSNLSTIDMGNYELATYDLDTKKIEKLNCFSNGKNINPQWSADGKSTYFISDQNGIPDIYKLNLSDNTISQLTNIYTGVSGITNLSPALSVAGDSNKIVYSVYDDGKYSIYSYDNTKPHNVNIVRFDNLSPGKLPPVDRVTNFFVNNLENPKIGFPADSTFKYTGYSSSLSLVGMIQPSLGGGVDRFGTYVAGGVTLLWSDILGDHNLATALQIESAESFKFNNIYAYLGYLNTASRWAWGGVVQQVPYLLDYYNEGYGSDKNGDPAYIQEEIIQQEVDRNAQAIVQYPFSEESRVEFSAGFENISFKEQVITQTYSLTNGNEYQDITDLPVPNGLNLGEVSAAYVFDNSIFGATSPILGERYRIEATPIFGGLNFVNLLGDYRLYEMPVRPFTLAGRILHFGRYGSGAEDDRIYPLYLGDPGLVRGYDFNSFSASEIGTSSSGSLYDRLLGSKILVANFELRFPLFGVFGIGSGYYGLFPIELAGFYDAGVVWQNGETPFKDSKPVSSTGIAIRINLLGMAVAEVDYVHPFNRPEKKWLWQFGLVQGF